MPPVRIVVMGEDMTTPEEIANEQSKPGVFNLVERLQNRNMPSEDIDVYLDEKLGWDLIRLTQKHDNAKKADELKELEDKIARVRKQLQDSRYVFTVQGMSNERYDELIDQVAESFPYDYEESVSPLTGQRTKVVVESEERDALFNTLFLAEAIVKVTDPDGNVDDNITPETVAFMKTLGPLDGLRRITEVAAQMRMAAAWMDGIQDEDFSPRP